MRTGAATLKAQPARAVLPYGLIAGAYDRWVGDALFPAVCSSFEAARHRFGLRFASAADIGCGTGRFLQHLLRFGVPLWGVDRSLPMLRLAARRLAGSGIRLLQQDLRALRLPRRVDLITCNGDTLNYLLQPRDLVHAFVAFAAALTPGGHLVCDFLSGVPVVPGATTQRIEFRGLRSHWQYRVDPVLRLTEVRVHGRRRGATMRQVETHVQRWLHRDQVVDALAHAGFAVRGLWPIDGEARPQRAWLKLVATRR